jgi:hypothetical protein
MSQRKRIVVPGTSAGAWGGIARRKSGAGAPQRAAAHCICYPR